MALLGVGEGALGGVVEAVVLQCVCGHFVAASMGVSKDKEASVRVSGRTFGRERRARVFWKWAFGRERRACVW